MEHTKIEIKTSKKKLTFALIGSIVFVLLAISILVLDRSASSSLFILSGLTVGIVFFGYGSFVLPRRIMSNKPAIIIDETGITYNAELEGKISWNDIEQISLKEIHAGFRSQQFVIIAIKNPEGFIAAQKSAVKRSMMKFNLSQYGGPISISAGLEIPTAELYPILLNAQEKYTSVTVS